MGATASVLLTDLHAAVRALVAQLGRAEVILLLRSLAASLEDDATAPERAAGR